MSLFIKTFNKLGAMQMVNMLFSLYNFNEEWAREMGEKYITILIRLNYLLL